MSSSHQGRRVIGHYELGDTLGKGMSGKVRLGLDTTTGELVAIKIMFKERMSRRAYSQLTMEIGAMQTLKHPHILRLKDVIMEADYVKKNGMIQAAAVLVIEIAKGGELFDFMMFTGGFPELFARTYFYQLIAALDACHRQGIAHRDVKPENILLDAQYNLKLADFGLSSYRDGDGSLCKTECGTRSYMAPEVLAREQYVGSKADIWSAGVVLFILLNGNPPFQTASSDDWWFRAIAANRYDRFWAAHLRGCPAFPPGAQDLLNTIFVKDPATRTTITQLLAHPWMQGPMASAEELQHELAARKMRVDEEKARAKQAHIMAKLAEAQRTGGGALRPADAVFRRNVQRSVTDVSDVGVVGGIYGGDNSEGDAVVVPIYPTDDKQLGLFGKSFHSLYSVESVEDLLKKLPEALATCTDKDGGDVPLVTVKHNQAKIKAIFPQRQMEVVVRIYVDETTSCHLIVVNKRQGDVYDFQEMQDKLAANMGGTVARANDAAKTGLKEAYDDDDDELLGGGDCLSSPKSNGKAVVSSGGGGEEASELTNGNGVSGGDGDDAPAGQEQSEVDEEEEKLAAKVDEIDML